MLLKPLIRQWATKAIYSLFATVAAQSACVPTSQASPAVQFGSPFRSLNVQATALGTAISDMNGDLLDDIVVLTATTVIVLLNDGAGSFRRWDEVRFPLVGSPVSHGTIVLHDLDGDGALDVLVRIFDSLAKLYAFYGKGTGDLHFPVEIGKNRFPHSFDVGDLNSDGAMDIALVGKTPGAAQVLWGDTNGAFSEVEFFLFPESSASTPGSWVQLDDINQDGKLELIVGYPASLSVFRREIDGSFVRRDRRLQRKSSFLDIADMDSDGILDALLLMNRKLWMLPGTADGFFGLTKSVDSNFTFATILDLDSDGLPDLVSTWGSDHQVEVQYGTGVATFAPPVAYSVGGDPVHVALGDVDQDGDVDMVSSDKASRSISVLHYAGSRQIGKGLFTTVATGRVPLSLVATDLSGDGRVDLVTANSADHNISLLKGTLGAWTESMFESRQDYETGFQPVDLTASDLNQDGRDDLIVVNRISHSLSILLGDGAGGFVTHSELSTGFWPRSVAVGDIDGDGQKDLVTANNYRRSLSFMRGQGSGNFERRIDLDLREPAHVVTLGDMDMDGDLDAAIGGGSLQLLQNVGPGALQDWGVHVGTPSVDAKLVHLNDDAFVDLAALNSSTSQVRVLRGSGIRFFVNSDDYAVGLEPRAIAIGDLNNDGIPDLATANSGSNNITVLLGQGNGLFGQRSDYGAGRTPSDIAIADFDLDGWNDIAVLNRASNDIFILRNMNGPGPMPPVLARPTKSSTTLWIRRGPDATYIHYQIATRAQVRVDIIDVRGRRLQAWTRQEQGPGEHVLRWEGNTHRGPRRARGVYFVRLRTESEQATAKIVDTRR